MVLERIKKETGLPLLHAHQLRHTAATMMVRQHADLHTVKRILGHSQLSTVEWYLSLDNTDLKDKHTSASPFEKIRSTIEPESVRGRRRLKAS
jgi:site-specific recombinase XerD